MKKIFLVMILLAGITGAKHALAQYNPATIFDITEEKFTRRFTVEFDRNNKMEVSVTAMSNLAYISNIDSIIKIVMNQLDKIKDTPVNYVMWRKIDYNMDDSAVKKLRIVRYRPEGNDYVFVGKQLGYLQVQQDTLTIHGRIPWSWLQQAGIYKPKYYRNYYFKVSFYLNNLKDLEAYRDGRLNEKIRIIQQHYKDYWQSRSDERLQLKNHPEITAETGRGAIYFQQRFRFRKSVEIQNYKNYFIPSISITPTFIYEQDLTLRELGASFEAAFSFEKPDSTLKTHMNLFAGLSYNVLPLAGQKTWLRMYPYINIAYLLYHQGAVFDKNSFRIALGNFSFGNLSTKIQPAVYFNNFFKDVTPSLRIVQRF